MTSLTPQSREAAALNRPAVRQPPRRAHSVRRTSSHQALWGDAEDRSYRLAASARDLRMDDRADAIEVDRCEIEGVLRSDGRVLAMASPQVGQVSSFTGLRAGGELRKAMAEAGDQSLTPGTLGHRLLDDLAGEAFMAKAAWYGWPGGNDEYARISGDSSPVERPVAGVCLSYVPGSPAMTEDGRSIDGNANHPLGPNPIPADDPLSFHALIPYDGPNQWRLRRTDLWRESGDLLVDSWFQDSGMAHAAPSRRIIFHEYGLTARIDASTMRVTDIAVEPYVLPYVTCRAAPATAKVLLGQKVQDFPRAVLNSLRGTAGCTHLNDMMRALADVDHLARALLDLPLRPGADARGSIAD